MTQFDQKKISDETERQLAHPLVEDGFPYRTYFATCDARTSKQHLAMESLGIDGTAIYHCEDPVWKVFRPPWGARHCRCSWSPTSVEQAAKKGVREAQAWLERAKAMAQKQGGSEYEYLTEVAPTTRQFVTFPAFSLDSPCEPGALYLWDYPLILDDLKSADRSHVARAIEDIRSLVLCKGNQRALWESQITVPVLVDMAEALRKVHENALAAWPALISCFAKRMSGRGETVSFEPLLFDAMRNVLRCGRTDEREQILPVWITHEDADACKLVEMLTCRHWDVRKAAAERLGQLGRDAAGAIDQLQLLASDRSKYVRAAALEAINRIRSIGADRAC